MADGTIEWSEAIEELKSLVDDRIADVYTAVFVVVEEVDHETRRCVVSHKDDPDVMADNVPILSTNAGDGYGTIEPVAPGDEGIAFFAMDPLDEALQERGHQPVEKQRRHSVQDALFMPQLWFDPDDVPDYEDGERLVFHESGSYFSIKPDGRIELAVERSDGDHVSATLTDEGVVFDAPDRFKEHRSDPRVTMGVRDDGTSQLGGRSVLGDTDANRIDRDREDFDPDSPYQYEQVDERVEPIADIEDDGETAFDNAATAQLAGPLDGRMYEARGLIPWERRIEDPDPTTTDPTDPTYVDIPDELRAMGELPWFIPWVHVGDRVARWWVDGAPEDIFP